MHSTASIIAWPKKTGEMINAAVDSRRWNDFVFRPGDIVISTWMKSGTTLAQQIVAQLIFNGDPAIFGQALSPWIDFRHTPEAVQVAERQSHRRFMKTHLPVNALVFSPKAKYIYIGRDARDVAWSLHHHSLSITPAVRAAEAAHGMEFPKPDPDIRRHYHDFLDGCAQPWPFWPHVQGWWDIRHLPNVLLLHFARLTANLPQEIRRIATFLEMPIDESQFDTIVANCGLEHMRRVAAEDALLNFAFEKGAQTFFHKGTNGRWKDVLSAEDVAKSDEIAAKNLSADCAHWLKTGNRCAE
jgi:aryl sulfotransferase